MIRHSPPGAHGFSLIEVLVAMIILLFGLLGVVGLQATSIKVTSSSSYRSVAASQAASIADRIRANLQGFDNGDYFGIWGTPGSLPANQNCYQVYLGGTQTPAACDTVKLALDDAFIWQSENARYLPSGFGVVCRDNSPDDGTPAAPACTAGASDSRVVIKIWWNDSRAGGAAEERFVTVFQP